MKRIARLYAMAIALAAVAVPCVSAQDYYDDDLYYSPSQAAKARAEAEKALAAARAAQAAREQAAGLGAADTYTDGSAKPLAMDVDTYNRRNGTAPGGTKSTLPETGFSYTRRIERFHNPDIVSASGDTTLMDYYYETPSQQDINVYVINSIDPVGSYNPWPAYDYLWSPSWSLSWNFAPGWSFGWGFRPCWGYNPWWGNPWWGPSWSYDPWWGPSWGWGGPVWGGSGRPHYTSSGAYAPNRPHTSSGTYRNNTYRNGAVGGNRGSIGNSRGRRPSASGTVNSGNINGAASGSRPGYRQPIGRPNTSGNAGTGSSSGAQRGRGGYINRQSGVNQNTNTQRYNNSSPNRSNSYNSGSYNPSRGRSGSIGSSSGSRGGGFSGGGSSRGSSGGHRGR